MALGIYKPGQGYWMRVVTACMLGVLTLATAMWLSTEVKALAGRLPSSGYTQTLATSTGTPPQAGQRITLLNKETELGTAEVVSVDTQNKLLVFRSPQMADDRAQVGDTREVRAGDAAAPAFFATASGPPRAQAAIEPLYLQGGTAILVLILGCALIYWVVAHSGRSVEFLIATDMEMKKVNWSTRRDITGSTWVVIGASLLISAFLFVFDLILKSFFQLIGVLEG